MHEETKELKKQLRKMNLVGELGKLNVRMTKNQYKEYIGAEAHIGRSLTEEETETLKTWWAQFVISNDLEECGIELKIYNNTEYEFAIVLLPVYC